MYLFSEAKGRQLIITIIITILLCYCSNNMWFFAGKINLSQCAMDNSEKIYTNKQPRRGVVFWPERGFNPCKGHTGRRTSKARTKKRGHEYSSLGSQEGTETGFTRGRGRKEGARRGSDWEKRFQPESTDIIRRCRNGKGRIGEYDERSREAGGQGADV